MTAASEGQPPVYTDAAEADDDPLPVIEHDEFGIND